MTLPYVRGLPVRVKWLTVTVGTEMTDVYAGDIEITGYTRRATTAWRNSLPVGATAPVRRLRSAPGAEVDLNGVLVPGRLTAGRELLTKMQGWVGKEVTIDWVFDGSSVRYLVEDVQLDLRWGHAIVMGGSFRIRLYELGAAPTVAPAPQPQPVPGLSSLGDFRMNRGTSTTVTIVATVSLGNRADGGYYLIASADKAGLVISTDADELKVSAPPAVATGDYRLSVFLRNSDNDLVDTKTFTITVEDSA